MIFFIVFSGSITLFAILLCKFSGRQQRKEDEYLVWRHGQLTQEELDKIRKEREDWDLLNNWDHQ